MMTKKKPNIAKNCSSSDADPVAKPRNRNRWGSSIGAVARSSTRMNAASTRAPPIRPVSLSGAVQPRVGPSMIPSTTPPMPTIDSSEPAGSRPTRSLARVEGTATRISTKVRTRW
jgi:hypothetical protein